MTETTRTELVQRLRDRMEILQARHRSTGPMIMRLTALALAPLEAADADQRVSDAADADEPCGLPASTILLQLAYLLGHLQASALIQQ